MGRACGIASLLAFLCVSIPSPAYSKRSFSRPQGMKTDRELLTVNYKRQTIMLQGAEICSTGCANPNPDGATYPQELSAACRLYEECVELARHPNTSSTFPNFDESWCDNTIEELGGLVCLKADGNNGQLVMSKLENVTRIVSSKQTAGWHSCKSQGHETCTRCLGADHRGGIKDYFVTSHACAWHGDHCGSAHLGEPTVSDRAACRAPAGSVPADLKLDLEDRGDAEGESFAQLHVASNTSLSRASPTVGKKAFLMAYEYPGTKDELGGTIPDIVRVFRHLTQDRGFRASDITVFHDDSSFNGNFKGANLHMVKRGSATELLGLLQETLDTLRSGDFFVFHYSGHGYFVRDQEGDELDGLDEVICMPNGENLRDDDFYKELAQIPSGVAVTAIVDACHCEGFSDLPFNYMTTSRSWCTDWTGTYNRGQRSFPQATITFISGSQNHQTSADLGDAGALSMHAIQNWDRPKVFHEALAGIKKKFKKNGITQVPNVAAWPTFRDTGKFSPWNPNNVVPAEGFLIRDPAIGGPAPNQHLHHPRALVPQMCSHGYASSDGVSHKRTKGYASEFIFSPKLTKASNGLSPDQLPTEGWVIDGKPAPGSEDPNQGKIVTHNDDWDEEGDYVGDLVDDDVDDDVPDDDGDRLKKLIVRPIRGKSGFRMMPSDGYVDKVTPGGAAAKAGLRVGHTIIFINDKDALKLSEAARKRILSSTQYELTVV